MPLLYAGLIVLTAANAGLYTAIFVRARRENRRNAIMRRVMGVR